MLLVQEKKMLKQYIIDVIQVSMMIIGIVQELMILMDFKLNMPMLYMAILEGGPNQDGSFTDTVSSYQNTEVAIHYNFGFIATLYSIIKDQSGESLNKICFFCAMIYLNINKNNIII